MKKKMTVFALSIILISARAEIRYLTLNADTPAFFKMLDMKPTNQLTWKLYPEFRTAESAAFNATFEIASQDIFLEDHDDLTLVMNYQVVTPDGSKKANIRVSQIKKKNFQHYGSVGDRSASWHTAEIQRKIYFQENGKEEIDISDHIDQVNFFSETLKYEAQIGKNYFRINRGSDLIIFVEDFLWKVSKAPEKNINIESIDSFPLVVAATFVSNIGTRNILMKPDSIIFLRKNEGSIQIRGYTINEHNQIQMDLLFILNLKKGANTSFMFEGYWQKELNLEIEGYKLFSFSMKEEFSLDLKRIAGFSDPTFLAIPEKGLAGKNTEDKSPYTNKFAEVLLGF